MDLEVYMVKVSYNQKPYRRFLMETYGAQVFASPSDRTHAGQGILAQDPESPGSLGIAISEAVEVAATSGGHKKYRLGSVLNHVLLHQTVIGEESLKQMDMAGEYPDMVIGCVGGGSNFGGIALPFLRENLDNGRKTRLMAVEPKATPSLTRGIYAFDYGDTAQMAPIVKMHTLGHDFIPPAIHAGGLRYHGMAPMTVRTYDAGLIEAVAVAQLPVFEAAVLFAHRGHPARPRVRPRHPRGHRRSAEMQGDRRKESYPLQPFRARQLRSHRVQQIQHRPTRRLRISRGSHFLHPAAPPEGPGPGLVPFFGKITVVFARL